MNMINKNKNKTFNVCYLREYLDPDYQGDFFYAYETVYRNVPAKFKSKFTKERLAKIKFLCDNNFQEGCQNFCDNTKVTILEESQYYQTYSDVFGETAKGDNQMFNDYGQKFDRYSFRKDFNPKLTRKYIPKKVDKPIDQHRIRAQYYAN